jgi:NAD(P)H-hydrate epimerase
MTVFVTPHEMRAAEAASVAEGRPETDLMRAAASAMAAWIDRHITTFDGRRRHAVALVGPGNNGGDALVTLALLIERGWRCSALLLGRAAIDDVPAGATSLRQIRRLADTLPGDADVVLDGVYGVGGRATLGDSIVHAIREAHSLRQTRGTTLVAIDVPSGTDPASGMAHEGAFRADVTLCLGLPKLGLIREPAATHVGELELVDIGIAPPALPRSPRLIDETLVRSLLPQRAASAHKYDTGTLLVVGGAPAYYGAPRLSAAGAMRAGAGLVCVAAPTAIVPVIATQVPELVFLPLADEGSVAVAQLRGWIAGRRGHLDALVIGPGLGRDDRAERICAALLGPDSPSAQPHDGRPATVPCVVDADALHWLATLRDPRQFALRDETVVLTPHAGEMARLLEASDAAVRDEPIDAAREAARRFGQVVILKSGYSLVATPDGDLWVAPRAAPELATAGTGDVLAGLIGGMLAQSMPPLDAARAALFVGAMAGRAARAELGTLGTVATDVIGRVPGVLARLTDAKLHA